MHEKAHEAGTEQRGQVRIERGLALRSIALGLVGKADVVEFHQMEKGWQPYPVEYKRGKTKSHDADRLQLCAQAICLEEMLDVRVSSGALFYGANRRREEVIFSDQLRDGVVTALNEVRGMLESGKTPPPKPGPYCRNCSLLDWCLPKQTSSSRSARSYLDKQIKAAKEEK